MAYIDYIHCAKCGCKVIYDGDDNGCYRLRAMFGAGHEDDPDWAMESALLCPDCVKKLQAELAAALEHARKHTPTLERIKEAHSLMTPKMLLSNETYGHRVYCQDPDETCYLCALIVLLEKANKELAAAQEDAERWQTLMRFNRRRVIQILQRAEVAERHRPAGTHTLLEEIDAARRKEPK